MKKYLLSASTMVLFALMLGTDATAQQPKEKKKIDQFDEIIIKKKTDKNEKVVIEIKDDEILVNGKPIEDFDNDNVSVKKRKPAVIAYSTTSPFRSGGNWSYNGEPGELFTTTPRALLGVTTESDAGGAKVMSVSKGSGAEKAGLLKGDIITKIDDAKIDDHSDLSSEIGKRKPDDKVLVTIKRDGKEQKFNATLGKTSSTQAYNFGSGGSRGGVISPRIEGMFDNNHNFNFDGLSGAYTINGRPMIGIRAQDTEDGKGVKVIGVTEESAAAKAGIKENDIILEFGDEKTNSADELSAASRQARTKFTIPVKLSRNGKTESVEIKIPRKLKTTNL